METQKKSSIKMILHQNKRCSVKKLCKGGNPIPGPHEPEGRVIRYDEEPKAMRNLTNNFYGNFCLSFHKQRCSVQKLCLLNLIYMVTENTFGAVFQHSLDIP